MSVWLTTDRGVGKGKLTRDITKNCQQNVDQEVSTTSALEEDTKRWEDDGENDLADIAIEHVSFPPGWELKWHVKVWGK